MKMSIKASALVIGMAATAGMVLPIAAPAGAALKASVSCKTETSPPLSKGAVKSTVGKCTPAALAAGGTSTTKAKAGSTSGQSTSTTTWKNGKGTTTATIKYKGAATKGKCKAPYDTRVTITGKVTKATGAAAKITKVGEPVTASICAITKGAKLGQTTIEPGTLFKL
jgi:hypothetical protein